MRPTDQTVFGVPEGNCTSACIASLLEVPIEEVPHFGTTNAWSEALRKWLRPRGFDALFWQIVAETPYRSIAAPDGTWLFSTHSYVPDGYYLLGGESARGPHAVVAKSLEIVFDPHPSRAGLVSIGFGLALVPLDPAETGRLRIELENARDYGFEMAQGEDL